jgi:CheY-like chemotaxis protein
MKPIRSPKQSSTRDEAPPSEPRRRILYVEDDEDNRLVARIRLAKKYDIVFAATDVEACAAMTQHGPDLALILMDIELKDSQLNGIALTRLARGHLAATELPSYAQTVQPLTVPILFVTAFGTLHGRDQLIAAGADDVISKPVDFVALHTAMTRIYLQRLR